MEEADVQVREYTAIHEAGHAIAALEFGVELVSVDVLPRIRFDQPNSLGVTNTYRNGCNPIFMMAYCFAGVIAEATINPTAYEDEGYAGDLSTVTKLAMEAALESMGPPEVTIPWAMKMACGAVKDNLPAVQRVAAALLDRQELTGEEVISIVREVRNEGPVDGPGELEGFY